MKIKKIIMVIMAMTIIFSLTACQSTDVVAKVGVSSFEAVTNVIPDKIAYDQTNDGWALTSPTGNERFVLSKDFSNDTVLPDIMVEFDAAPFVSAGLDIKKLPEDQYKYIESMGKIMMHYEYGQDKFAKSENIMDSFKEIVKTHRDLLGYHEKLDHYGLALGNGNMFEWAKDMSTNDKDIVFVLNPEPFIKAGVDPAKVQEWVFAKVEVKNKEGKKELVDKFLKPFNLK